jgi:hypothetical protein
MMTRQGRIHYHKTDNPYPLEMIQQAIPALEYLNLFSGLTSWQVCKLLFLNQTNSLGQIRSDEGAKRATNRECLRRLKDLGLVRVKPIPRLDNPLTKWELNHLTPRGYETLKTHRESLGLATLPFRRPENLTYQTINPHSMSIKDALISVVANAPANHLEVEVVLDDMAIRSMRKSGQLDWPMEPDFVVILKYGEKRWVLFGEVDMATESVVSPRANSWSTKIGKYKTWSAAMRQNDPWLGQFSQPDVMVIAPSVRRMYSLLEATRQAGGRSAYWFTTTEYLEPPYSFLGEVWQRIGLQGYYSPTERFVS